MISDTHEEMFMYETKQDTDPHADPLQASFAGAEDIAQLKAGMADLKAKLDGARPSPRRARRSTAPRPRLTPSARSSSAICATA